MKRRQGWLFFIIFLLTFSIYLLINFPLQLGLDLKGGSQLTLQLIKEEGKVSKEELDAVNAVLDKRVNNLGVAESNLQTLGPDQLILELIAIDFLKNKDDYEISLIFSNNAYIALTTETIEVRLEDQNKIK